MLSAVTRHSPMLVLRPVDSCSRSEKATVLPDSRNFAVVWMFDCFSCDGRLGFGPYLRSRVHPKWGQFLSCGLSSHVDHLYSDCAGYGCVCLYSCTSKRKGFGREKHGQDQSDTGCAYCA